MSNVLWLNNPQSLTRGSDFRNFRRICLKYKNLLFSFIKRPIEGLYAQILFNDLILSSLWCHGAINKYLERWKQRNGEIYEMETTLCAYHWGCFPFE